MLWTYPWYWKQEYIFHSAPLPLFHFFPWGSWRSRKCPPHFAFVMVKINFSFPQNVLECRRTSISRFMHPRTRGMSWNHRRQERILHRWRILKRTLCMQCKSRNREMGQETLGVSLSTGRKRERSRSSMQSLLRERQSITKLDSQYRRNHYPLLSMQPSKCSCWVSHPPTLQNPSPQASSLYFLFKIMWRQ